VSKEKKNRFYYSKKQSEIYEEMWNMPTRFTFVKTPDGWKQYSEWCSVKSAKCNWEDAKLVYETDDEPEVIIHECIPELIADLEAKLAESEARAERNKNWFNEKAGECAELKQQLAEKETELELARNTSINTNKMDILHLEVENSELKQQLAEKEELKLRIKKLYKLYSEALETVDSLFTNQDKISFAVEILEELADCSNYINSSLDFECGSYVSEKSIRDKIKYLKGKKDE
jgi:hypothetical protein